MAANDDDDLDNSPPRRRLAAVGFASWPLVLAAFLLAAGYSVAGLAQQVPEQPHTASQPPNASSAQERADALQKEALSLYTQYKLKESLATLRAARAIAPAPLQLYNLGLVKRELKDFPGAVTSLHAYLDEASAEDEEHGRMTRALLAELEPLVVCLRLDVPNDRVEIALDDERVAARRGTLRLWTSPGAHRIVATEAGRMPFEYEAEFAAGDVDTIRVLLPSAEPDPADGSGPVQAVSIEPVASSGSGREMRLWFGWTTTAVLGISATIVGVMALREEDKLQALKRNLRQEEWDQTAADKVYQRMTRYALVTDVLWPMAIVAGAVALWWTFDVDRPGELASAAATTRIAIGLGRLELARTF